VRTYVLVLIAQRRGCSPREIHSVLPMLCA
jgi:hypothetical protein